jgi:hypothetical protein
MVTTTITWLDRDSTYSHLTNHYVYFDWEKMGKWRWHQHLLTVICCICIRNATWSPVKRWDTQLSVLWQHSHKCCLLIVSRQNTILVMVHTPDVLRLQGSNYNTKQHPMWNGDYDYREIQDILTGRNWRWCWFPGLLNVRPERFGSLSTCWLANRMPDHTLPYDRVTIWYQKKCCPLH